MEPRFILAIAGAALFIAVLSATRRSAKGNTRFKWLFVVPLLPGGLAMIWGGISIAASSLALGVVMATTGAITVLLLVRALRAASSSPWSAAQASGVPEPWVDYLIWTAIGVPIVLAVVLLVFAIADRYNSP